MRADEILTAFIELESAIRGRIGLTTRRDSQKSVKDLNQAEDISPAGFFASSGPAIAESTRRGKEKGNHMNPLIQLKKQLLQFSSQWPASGFHRWRKQSYRCRHRTEAIPANNTAEGDGALFSLTTGANNTAIGFEALYYNSGDFNTANGASRCLATFMAGPTRPPVLKRSQATRPATTTRPTVRCAP